MASDLVLRAAIKLLEKQNYDLRTQIHNGHCDEKSALEKISRNDSMILDYKFRLQNAKN